MAAGIEEVEYGGHQAVRFEAGGLVAFLATGFGPRLIGLESEDSGNLFAVLPDTSLATGDGRWFRFRGGHRLWEAPEIRERTYRPDDEPVDIRTDGDALWVAGGRDAATGLRRRVGIVAADGHLTLRHTIANEGEGPLRIAAWAITQLPVGGRARLSLRAGEVEPAPDAVLPDRALVLWPYTDLADPRIHLEGDHVDILASWPPGEEGRLKVGTPGGDGRLTYVRDGWRFEKAFRPERGATYADFGAAAQVYADERFIELETLGPLVDLAPGATIEHAEHWRVSRATEDA